MGLKATLFCGGARSAGSRGSEFGCVPASCGSGSCWPLAAANEAGGIAAALPAGDAAVPGCSCESFRATTCGAGGCSFTGLPRGTGVAEPAVSAKVNPLPARRGGVPTSAAAAAAEPSAAEVGSAAGADTAAARGAEVCASASAACCRPWCPSSVTSAGAAAAACSIAAAVGDATWIPAPQRPDIVSGSIAILQARQMYGMVSLRGEQQRIR